MAKRQPEPWHCGNCGAQDSFRYTSDRLLHVRRGHIGNVVDADGNRIILSYEDDGKPSFGKHEVTSAGEDR